MTIVHAQRASAAGDTQVWGLLGCQKEAAFAADRVIVVVEELVDEAVIRADPNRTIIPGLIVDAVVVEPWGAHPSYAQGYYDRDNRFYLDWDPISRDEAATQAWLREWVHGVDGRAAYLEKLGAERIASLEARLGAVRLRGLRGVPLMGTTVRYLVADVDRAVAFYRDQLGFGLIEQMSPAFAQVRRGDLPLWLSGPPSSASRPMPDGRQPSPGGWNRFVIEVDDLGALVEAMTAAGVPFRNTDRDWAGWPADPRRRSGRQPDRAVRGAPMTETLAFSKSEMMIVAAARALAGQHVCFVGVGLPNIAVNLAKRTVAPDLELVYEAGVFGARPARLPLSIGDPTIVTGATAVVSMLELFGYYLQRGLIDVGFLGAAQIDRFGNINTTVIGDYEHPKTRLPGSGGACEIAINAREVFVIMRQSTRSFVETDRLPDQPRQPGRGRAGRADPARGRLARPRARRSSSRTSASTTSTRPARCGSIRSTRARRWTPSAPRSAGTSRSPRTWPRPPRRPTRSSGSSARNSTRAASTRSSVAIGRSNPPCPGVGASRCRRSRLGRTNTVRR